MNLKRTELGRLAIIQTELQYSNLSRQIYNLSNQTRPTYNFSNRTRLTYNHLKQTLAIDQFGLVQSILNQIRPSLPEIFKYYFPND